MKEKKTNKLNNEMPENESLNDETLNDVSGGASFVVIQDKDWCSHCNDMVMYRVIVENGETRKECLKCHNPL